jgi:hypothetical protein
VLGASFKTFSALFGPVFLLEK